EARSANWAEKQAYDYTRVANPTTDITEAKIAALEGGEKARCFGSGAAAVSAAIFSCVKGGDHVIAPQTVYGPTRQLLADYLKRFGVETTLVEGSDPQEWADALRPNTTLFYLESPSSMIFKQQDLAALAALAKAHGIATICDNSWATPYFQNPLKLGVDLVLHSATKYLGGHSDVVAGVVVGKKERMQKMVWEEGCLLGAVLDPFASWLLLRGLRTLPIRMERHQQNAKRLAIALSEHPAVAAVFYPGMPSDPQHELTCRQLRGTSGLFSIELKTPGKDAIYRFVNALHYFGIGCSWGGFESLATAAAYPASTFGRPGDEYVWFVRLHIGLESADDLWDDLEQALAQVPGAGK
ncbi:MAG TPA: aminotransferase class I/II-fold pyridoxal phosphate-dependent enzyme, partial [Chthonomonadaceae bacterium]|nr:aminotransferase class I/II-fold pyridoxal phosphate-dependent enzyme [Chthonomonadaceae bacterium]